MNSHVVISVKIDSQLKQESSIVAKQLGISLAAYIQMALEKLVREKKIEASIEKELKPDIAKMLEGQDDDFQKGVHISGPFLDAEEFCKDLT